MITTSINQVMAEVFNILKTPETQTKIDDHIKPIILYILRYLKPYIILFFFIMILNIILMIFLTYKMNYVHYVHN